MCGSAALTALGLALPWQNTTRGGRWFFSFPEGWIAAAATVIGFELAVNTLSEKWPLARRRRVAAISVLCSVIVLATVGFFAVKMLMNTDRSIGSGAGSLLMSVANLAWTFTAVKRHVQLREIERRQPKPAPAPPPDATPPTSE
jgi:TRAP-type C4-dicarboxylate transport system permease small subunit